MNTDLVRTPGFGKHAYDAESPRSRNYFIEGHSLTATGVAFAYRHFFTLTGVDADRLLNHVAVPVRLRGNDRQVLLCQRSCGELARQMLVCPIGFGHDEDAAGVAVEPVDNARSMCSTRGTELTKMKRQCRDERAGGMSLGWVDHHPRRLVDDDQLVVFPEDIERDVLPLGRRNLWLRKLDRNGLIRSQPERGSGFFCRRR